MAKYQLRLSILVDTLKQVDGWGKNLSIKDLKDRVGWSNHDKGTIQSLKYWLDSYMNGLKLRYGVN